MRRTLAGLVLLAGLAAPAPAADPPAAKPFTWQSSAPASQGMSRDNLDALRDDLARRGTTAFRQGERLAPPPAGARDDFERFHDPLARLLFEPLVAAVRTLTK